MVLFGFCQLRRLLDGSGDVPGARPANSRTRRPFRGGGAVMVMDNKLGNRGLSIYLNGERQ